MTSDWAYLPLIIIEDIYTLLRWRERKACSQVCSNWNDVFYSPRVWRELIVNERTFTYSRFNLYKGYQQEVGPHLVQNCLTNVGANFRRIVIKPNSNFHNLYNVLSVLTSYLGYFDEYPMPLLEKFEFTFACETMDVWSQEFVILGTGGQLLDELKQLLGSVKGLKEVTVNNLFLEGKETPGFMDRFLTSNKESLMYMEVLNFTRYRHPFFYAGMFPNLRTLVLSPTQLTDSVVTLVAEKTQVTNLVIVQDRYSAVSECVTSRGWWEAKQLAPKLKVVLEVRGRTGADILIQPLAPVCSIIYSSTQSKVNINTIINIIEEYKTTLRCYGHKLIHRKYDPKSFYDRADTSLVMLVRQCPYINTLIITERVSTFTLLVIAKEGKSLKKLIVRKNAVILKADWPKSSDWSNEYYSTLKRISHSYEDTEQEICKTIQQPGWKLLCDKQFLTAFV